MLGYTACIVLMLQWMASNIYCCMVQTEVVCKNKAWQAASLKLLHERPFAALFLESIDNTVFDPTGLEHIDNIYYVVFNRQASLCLY